QEVLGKTDYDFLTREQADIFHAQDISTLGAGRPTEYPEEKMYSKSGIRFVRTQKIPVYDRDGRALYILGISEDITERRALDAERMRRVQDQSAREEAEKSAERMRFLNDASEALSSSLDLATTTNAFARIVITSLADYCEVV